MKSHLAVLDVARGLLAWWVVAAHILFFWHLPYDWLGAYWAVNCFCMISGFVITKLCIERPQPYPVYILRRFLRLWPVFILCTGLNMLAEGKGVSPLFIAQALMLQGVLFGDSSVYYLTPGWSVSLEWQFYLIAPFLIAFVLWLRRARWFLTLGFFGLYLPISGRLVWHFFDSYKNWYACWPMSSMLFLRLGFFYIGILAYHYWPNPVLRLPKWTRPLAILGELSYATYLVHWPILVFLSPRPNPILVVSLTLGASCLLHLLLERPLIALGKRLTRGGEAGQNGL